MSDALQRNLLKLGAGTAAFVLAAACNAADDLEGLVDPTAPINASVPLEDAGETDAAGLALPLIERYTLNSVLIRNNDRIAVVNNQRVRVGDRIGAATVSSIDEDGVLLDIDGETTALGLYGKPVKTLIVGEGP